MTPLESATLDFERMLTNGSLDGIILYDLIQTYKDQCETDNDWAIKDALKKVIKYYSTYYQYEQFKKEVGIDEG